MKRGRKFEKKSSPSMKIESKKKHALNLRNPLMDLNCISHNSTTTSSCSSSISVEASSVGCLSFFLSNSSSKNHLHKPKPFTRTPKSVPNSKIVKPRSKDSKPPTRIPEKLEAKKETPFLRQTKVSKNRSFTPTPVLDPKPSKVMVMEKKLASRSCLEEHQKWAGEPSDQCNFTFDSLGFDHEMNITPTNKLACGSSVLQITPGKESMGEDSIDKTITTTTPMTTPPVHASISPEIQCGSSMASTTASCFGAGHVLSGITDKRKCRPRGVLTVGEDLGLSSKARVSNKSSDDDDDGSFLNTSSLLSTPSKASMCWLLSPCKEEEDQRDIPQNGSPPELRRSISPSYFHYLSSPSSAHGFLSDDCNYSEPSCQNRRVVGASPPPLRNRPDDNLGSCFSPSSSVSTMSRSKVSMLKEDRGHRYDFINENSPLSMGSLGSHNAICTPESDSSSGRHLRFSWMRSAIDDQCELHTKAKVLPNASLSPKSRSPRWDPADVLPLPGLSFQFNLSTSPSNLSDRTELHKTKKALGISGSSFGNSSQSQTRISWREGLISRIFIDELDCCRWLSDEEEEIGVSGTNQLCSDFNRKLDMNVGDDSYVDSAPICLEFVSKEPGNRMKTEADSSPQIPGSCAESISTEGGGLIDSRDSDWNMCYKNHLFRV